MFLTIIILIIYFCVKANRKKNEYVIENNLQTFKLFCNNNHAIDTFISNYAILPAVNPFNQYSCITCCECVTTPIYSNFYRCNEYCEFNICKLCFLKALKNKLNIQYYSSQNIENDISIQIKHFNVRNLQSASFNNQRTENRNINQNSSLIIYDLNTLNNRNDNQINIVNTENYSFVKNQAGDNFHQEKIKIKNTNQQNNKEKNKLKIINQKNNINKNKSKSNNLDSKVFYKVDSNNLESYRNVNR